LRTWSNFSGSLAIHGPADDNFTVGCSVFKLGQDVDLPGGIAVLCIEHDASHGTLDGLSDNMDAMSHCLLVAATVACDAASRYPITAAGGVLSIRLSGQAKDALSSSFSPC